MNDNDVYEDLPDTLFCSECMCDVPTDSFGEPACKQCNPQYDPEMTDAQGNIRELDFHDAALKPFDVEEEE